MIDELKYLQRLGDVYLFSENIIGLGLDRFTSQKMAARLTGGIKDMLIDKNLWHGDLNEEQMTKLADNIEKDFHKENIAKVDNYKKWVLNYSLVMLCSIFDSYQEDLLVATLENNSELCNWNRKDEIVSRFRNSNAKSRMNTFINRLNFNEDELFDFSGFTPSIQNKFLNFDLNTYISIYKKRDKAAHTDSYVIYTLDDLLYPKDLFDKLVLHWSVIFREKWKIRSKIVEIYNTSNR